MMNGKIIMKKDKKNNFKSVRFSNEDIKKIQEISEMKGLSESESIRKAVEIYHSICKYVPERS